MKKIPKPLSTRAIRTGLRSLPGWRYLSKRKAIRVEWKMKDFAAVIRKIRKIAKLAEKAGHHPDLHLTRYRYLKVLLTTHEARGVTGKDLSLAKRISLKRT